MKRSMVGVASLALILAMTTAATASINLFVASNQLGYQGTVSNVTDSTGPWATPTPRDAAVYFTQNVPGYAEIGYDNYNQLLSNWSAHPTSNQNPGFFQLADKTMATVTSATGGWTQGIGGLWDFTITVTGENATYRNSTARLWQPDINNGKGGTFLSYTYTLTATGMQTEVATDGWRYNLVDDVAQTPVTFTGSFDATFLLTYAGDAALDGRPDGTEGGGPWDTYSVHLDLNSNLWDGTGFTSGTYSYFGAPVPEPATILVWSLLGVVAAGYGVWRRRAA